MSTRRPISPLFWARVSRSGIVAAGGVGHRQQAFPVRGSSLEPAVRVIRAPIGV